MTQIQATGLPGKTRAARTIPAMVPWDDTSFSIVDRMTAAQRARITGGTSPIAMAMAVFDWSAHLAAAPGKRAESLANAARQVARLAALAMRGPVSDSVTAVAPTPGDDRFEAEEWERSPYKLWAQAFLLGQEWWQHVTTNVPGVAPHHEDMVAFGARQFLDMMSPTNNPFTNPEVIAKTINSGGMNFLRGWQNWVQDVSRLATGQPPIGAEEFVVGRDVAMTPGKVVYHNDLIELIQYAPTTAGVRAEPVLIVPAWIMKYYILDLSPQNSLIRWLVAQGHTVFCISWRNPGAEDHNLSMEDYRRLGVMAALDAVSAIRPDQKVHAMGYCLGGTLLSIAAAAMGCRGDKRLASLTLLAAQTDFTEPGELALFIDHSQMHTLDSMMWSRGYLSAEQMAGAFQLLRANDLIWSRRVREYLLGERAPMFDLMAWNADSTRLPWRMHSEYLQKLYLDNELAAGRYMVDGRPAALQNIRVPLFVVGTERDHVAPWQSVYKIHYLTGSEVTFILASGGHNAGVISEPGRPRRHYRVATRLQGDLCQDADRWAEHTPVKQGSWWEEWGRWLKLHSPEKPIKAPTTLGAKAKGYAPGTDAPGTHVLQR